MFEFHDLSVTIKDKMPSHPYDVETNLIRDKEYHRDGYVNHILKTGIHTGTHLDVPMHFSPVDRFVSDYPIERFTGDAVVLDVRGEEIIRMDKSYKEVIQKDCIVLFLTGHSQKFGCDEYYDKHPVLSMELVQWLVDTGVKMIGVDTPSPDEYPFEIHKYLLGNGVFILENLRNLSTLPFMTPFELFAFPLKIEAEGSPVRVVAKVKR